MSGNPGFLNRPVKNKNHVPELVRQFQAAKAKGAFTFQAGRADRAINLCIGIAMMVSMIQVGAGVHQMANNYGRKEGF